MQNPKWYKSLTFVKSKCQKFKDDGLVGTITFVIFWGLPGFRNRATGRLPKYPEDDGLVGTITFVIFWVANG